LAAPILALFALAITWPALAASIPQKVHTAEELKDLSGLGIPRTFVKGEHVRLYFTNDSELFAFKTHWSKRRLDGRGYGYYTAELRFDKTPPKVPETAKQWREATVLGHEEWLKLSRAVAESLTTRATLRACYFQFGNSEGILYRDETNKLFSVKLQSNLPMSRLSDGSTATSLRPLSPACWKQTRGPLGRTRICSCSSNRAEGRPRALCCLISRITRA